jgi:membrane-bound serine protease (ClpP class)
MELSLPAYQTIAVLILVGFLMIAAEIFVPGLVLGTLGAICLLAAITWTFVEYGFLPGVLVFAGVGIFGLVGFLIWLSVFPKTFVGRQIINKNALPTTQNIEKVSLLGKTGTALSPLRPSGTARIDGRRIDVVAENGFIESGDTVVVVQIDGPRVVVRRQTS